MVPFFSAAKEFCEYVRQRKCIFFAEREQNAKRKRNPKKDCRRTCLAKDQLRSAKGVIIKILTELALYYTDFLHRSQLL